MPCCPPSDIAFSQVREDPNIELQVIDRLAAAQSHPLRVLMVASGGCTALSLLSRPAIAHIDAVDANIAQLHLVELRRQALIRLTLEEQLHLLGVSEFEVFEESGELSLELYDRLRSHLPEATRHYWNQRPDQITFGVNQVGRFEQLFRDLSANFSSIGLNPLDAPLTAIQHPQWSAIFNTIFERHKLIQTFGEAAVNYSMDRSFGNHFADVFANALTRFIPNENYFLTQVWADRYTTGAQGVPLYLQPSAQAIIRSLDTNRLKLHHGTFADRLNPQAKQFDLIQFSNISDWMPVETLHSMMELMVNYLAPGGAIIGRRLNGDHHLASIMATHLTVDDAFSQQLLENDRSFFYREVVVGYRA
ncbi:MAG: BtaA family protein [Leptolyngbyaceae cyanobacterium MAG.088]|nr:BtaA family protein [Leptolyngbyaceae cyanobacterium MAG.088]